MREPPTKKEEMKAADLPLSISSNIDSRNELSTIQLFTSSSSMQRLPENHALKKVVPYQVRHSRMRFDIEELH